FDKKLSAGTYTFGINKDGASLQSIDFKVTLENSITPTTPVQPKPVVVTPKPKPEPVVVTPKPKPVVVTPKPKPEPVVTPKPKPTGDSANSNSNSTGNNNNTDQTSSPSISTKKLVKKTTFNGNDAFDTTEYMYNSNNLVSKSLTTHYRGDSEEGDVTRKTISEYSYEKTYNMVRVISKTYNAENILIITNFELYTYNGDKIIRVQKGYIDPLGGKIFQKIGTFANYQGPIPKHKVYLNYNDDKNRKKITSAYDNTYTVFENKEVNSTEIIISMGPSHRADVALFSSQYDNLDRKKSGVFRRSYSETGYMHTYTYDAKNEMIEPVFSCFGGYVQMAKNHRSKYPKAENVCYLRSGGTHGSGGKYTYENTISNGLVIKRVIKEDGLVTKTHTYNYK
ncbi:MAG: hypothetical protein L3J43_04330, partial [Sulfurovum sp.]|nr:hypothetical protein [Sulfurovum sp.]